MNKIAMSVLILSALGVSATAQAAGEMKPGLWEMSTTLSAEQLANMPKDVKIAGLVGNVITAQTCITPAEAENLGMVDDEENDFCKIANKKTVGSTYSADLVCNGKDKKGTGKSTAVFKDSGNFTAVMEFTGTVFGQNVTERHESRGKWLNASCGSVK